VRKDGSGVRFWYTRLFTDHPEESLGHGDDRSLVFFSNNINLTYGSAGSSLVNPGQYEITGLLSRYDEEHNYIISSYTLPIRVIHPKPGRRKKILCLPISTRAQAINWSKDFLLFYQTPQI